MAQNQTNNQVNTTQPLTQSDKTHNNNGHNQDMEINKNPKDTANNPLSSKQQPKPASTRVEVPMPNPKIKELVKQVPKSDSICHDTWNACINKQRVSYSQVAARSTNNYSNQPEQLWLTEISNKLEKKKKQAFDYKL
ncbi:11939_t:CDS:2 [Dentiscutata erythropus]|uniref:11939_t:CDS:1 n=1 Tax=Dentiscutata erythropus TaxID=1348616 RepID=A0A9N9A2K9_9GLOM|nr:11939_t:CDS:2 [Dentiscutata erythropus]